VSPILNILRAKISLFLIWRYSKELDSTTKCNNGRMIKEPGFNYELQHRRMKVRLLALLFNTPTVLARLTLSACRILVINARWVPSSRKSIGYPWDTSLTVQGLLFRVPSHNLKVLSSNLSPATLRHLKGCLFSSKPPCLGFDPRTWRLSARF
jgi:hypothetical protein